MKPKVLISLVLTAIVLLIGCEQKEVEKNYLTERIQYDVKIKGDDPEADWWVENIVGPDREKFVKQIIEKARRGELTAYDYFNNPLTPEQVQNIGVDTLVQTLRRTKEPYDEYDTMIVTTLDYGQVSKIRFLEEWTWDEGTLEISKKVLGISPVVMVKVGEQEYNMPLFWVYIDDKYPEGI
jgi:hypothetical protein